MDEKCYAPATNSVLPVAVKKCEGPLFGTKKAQILPRLIDPTSSKPTTGGGQCKVSQAKKIELRRVTLNSNRNEFHVHQNTAQRYAVLVHMKG